MVRSLITAAMQASRTIKFTYTDAKSQTSERVAEPYEIKNGKVYTWDQGKDASRQYFLENISNVREGEVFRPRFPIVLPT